MPAITSANVASAIVKLVAARSMPSLVGNLIMGNLVNRDFEPVLAAQGDTVNVPLPATTMVTNNIAEGGAVVTQNPSLGNAPIVLNQHPECSFQIPDVTKALAFPDLLNTYMQPAINALAEKVETDLLATYASFTTNTPVGVGGTAVTEAVVDAAETALFKAKVAMLEQKNLVLHADSYAEVRQLPRFSEVDKIASGEAISLGQVGKLKDFKVFRSQFVAATGGGPVTRQNLAFHKNALGLVMRRLPNVIPGTGAVVEYGELGGFGFRIVMSYDANTLSQKFTIDALYGFGVLRNNHGIVVRG